MATVWFTGVCDGLLRTMQQWVAGYERGDVAATRLYLTHDLEKKDIPVQFAHKVPFSQAEMMHLVRILEELAPGEKFTGDFRKLYDIMRNPVLMRQYPKMMVRQNDGRIVMLLIFEKLELIKVLDILSSVKEGRATSGAVADPVRRQLEEKAAAGKGLWE